MQRTVTAPTHYRHSACIVHRQKWGKVFLNQRVAGVAGRHLIFFNLFLILVVRAILWITGRSAGLLAPLAEQRCAQRCSHPDHLSSIPISGLDGVGWQCRNPPRTQQALVSVEATHFNRPQADMGCQWQLLSLARTDCVPVVLRSWPWCVSITS